MKNQEEIKEVKDQMRELADRLEALETEPKRKPQAGDVWDRFEQKFLIGNAESFHLTQDCASCYGAKDFPVDPQDVYLGTFDEVYVLRSEAPEKDDLRQKLIDWRDSEGHPMNDMDSDDNEVAAFMFKLLGG